MKTESDIKRAVKECEMEGEGRICSRIHAAHKYEALLDTLLTVSFLLYNSHMNQKKE